MKKKSSLSRLFEYAGNYKYLTVLSWILSAVSAWIALVPFYYIWRIIKEVLAVAPDYSQAQNLKGYGWAAVGFALHRDHLCRTVSGPDAQGNAS